MGLTRLSITRPLAILMFIIGLLIMGVVSYQKLKVDRLPNISFPFVSVNVGWSGASAEDVEEYILKPVEGTIAGIPGVSSVGSSANAGRGSVNVQLVEGYDANVAAIDIERRVSAIRGRLPTDAGIPTVNKLDPNSFPIMNVTVTGNRPQSELYDIATTIVQPKVQSVLGVADVTVSGGQQKEVQVLVDINKMIAYNVTLPQIQNAINRENVNSPVGSLTEGRSSVNIRALGQYQTIDDIGEVVVSANGQTINGQASNGGGVRIKDVAKLTDDFKPRSRYQRLNGQDSVGMSVTKSSDANSLQVGDDVKVVLEKLKGQIPSDVRLVLTNDSTRFTRESLNAVQYDLGLAVMLTALVLLVFLHSWRNVLIVILAIPTSLISTFAVMYFAGISLNTISLMALALAIGILVDDSIVVMENIHRHLKMGEKPIIAALNGRSEIGLAAIAITMVDVVVYAPIAFMSGNIGKLFRDYGIVIAVATLFSLFVSFTLTPMLASRLLAAHRSGHKPGPSEWFGIAFDAVWDRIARLYGQLLRISLRMRPIVILIGVLAFAAAVSLVPTKVLKTEYAPTDDDNQFNMNIQLPVGTSLDAADTIVKQVEAVVKTTPEVDQMLTTVSGGSGGGFGGGGGSISVQLVDKHSRSRSVFDVVAELRDKVRSVQGATATFSIQNPLAGGGSGLNIRVLGEDFTRLQALSRQVETVIRDVPGIVDVRPPTVQGDPEVRFIANRKRMSDLGVSEQTVATTLRTAIGGTTVGQFRPEGELARDITMIVQASDRDDVAKLGAIPISLGTTGFTRVNQVAEVVRASAPTSISRQDRQRTLSVQATVAGRTLGEVSEDARVAIAKMNVPDGYQVVLGGAAQSLDTAFTALIGALSLSVLLIYMLMVALYENWLYPLVIMFALPLALVGAFVGLVVTGNTLNLFSMIGVIMLMGLVAKNGILLVDYTNTLRSRGMERNAALIEAGPTRLKPIIMTSFTICFAMLPLALKLESGAESRAPLAVVVIGGVISSTTLTLFFVPTMYTYLDNVSRFIGWLFRRGHRDDPQQSAVSAAETVAAHHAAEGTASTIAVSTPYNGNGSNGNGNHGEEIPNTGARPRRWGLGRK